MHVYNVQNVQIGLTASSHLQEIAKYPSVLGWMEARTRSLVDLKRINMNFSWILQRGAHIIREISTDLTEKFRQIQCTFFLPILSVNSCLLDDDTRVVDKTYSTTVTTATQWWQWMLFMLCPIAILRQDTRPPLRQISTWWLETTMQMEATLMRSAFWCISQLSWVKSSCGRAARCNHWKSNHSNQHAALSSFTLYFDYLVIYVIWYFFNLEETVMIKCQREPPKFLWPVRIPSGQVSWATSPTTPCWQGPWEGQPGVAEEILARKHSSW